VTLFLKKKRCSVKVDPFALTLRRQSKGTLYDVIKPKKGGRALVNLKNQQWHAPQAKHVILKCHFSSETMYNLLNNGQVFVLEVICDGKVVDDEIGDLQECKTIVGTWFASEYEPWFPTEDPWPMETLNGFVCSICKHSIPSFSLVQGFACGHYYHMECLLNPWFKSYQNTCHTCMFQKIAQT